jgi:putative oxidoreductase
MSMSATKEDLGKALLRVAVGGLMLLHGVHKLGHGISGIVASVGQHGMPAAVAYGVYVGEVIAPVLVLIGLFTRPAALVIAFNMLVAVSLVHSAQVFSLGKGGEWGIELQALYGLSAIAIALLGPGRYSVSRGKQRWD